MGRERFYELDPGPFTELATWLTQFAEPDGWGRRLDALETEVYRTRRDRRLRPATDNPKENIA